MVSRGKKMFAFTALGLLALVLIASASGAAVKLKPKYRFSVHIYGVPSRITLNQRDTYTISVKNTGTVCWKKKVYVLYSNGYTVTNSSLKPLKRLPRPDATVNWYQIRWYPLSIKAGATKRFTVTVLYKDVHPSGNRENVGVDVGVPGKKIFSAGAVARY